MKKLFNVLLMAVVPGIAGAAGTYYNTGYYGSNTNYNAAMTGRSYASRYGNQGRNTTTSTTRTTTRTVVKQGNKKSNAKKQGFVGQMGLSHEFANWNFDMKSAGSKLHYDNVRWNVLSGDLSYYFGDSTPMQIKVGARYGTQFDESPMIDDDISKGGYLVTTWTDDNDSVILGYQTGHALSVGTSKGGNQMGFNMSFGLPDYFTWGRAKITPSVGYRYFNYKLTTERNYGMTMDILESTDAHPYITCISGYMGELQCDPFLLFYTDSGVTLTGRVIDQYGNISDLIQMPEGGFGGVNGVSVGGSYYYEQSGTSHEYKTTWAGPYVALDAEYEIDNKNFVSGGIELGLPTYTSEGDQPYRYDWAHPKSVEDSGGFGDAIHLGLAAMWKTFVADSMMLTLGFTYDYYKVSGATAKTFLNSGYYSDMRTDYTNMLNDDYMISIGRNPLSDAQKEAVQDEIATINSYQNQGWTLESSNEIDSIYKSMGIRLGLEYKF